MRPTQACTVWPRCLCVLCGVWALCVFITHPAHPALSPPAPFLCCSSRTMCHQHSPPLPMSHLLSRTTPHCFSLLLATPHYPALPFLTPPCPSLPLIHHQQVWNLQDPCVIAGFDMDRLGTVQALALEPVGTFICRFSSSQPGCLVLSCRVPESHPNADSDGLLHAIIKLEDLFERRVETWIRDFAGATHILDVYRAKRVDKRKVFTSSYTRLRAMDVLDAYDDIYV
eukprot:GHRQ01013804.1.p1 GENE.GHRQ01013804.1~~GHRQ01013804.1.p1  ORF type:complete len:227 (+),score=22.07 GHRQ01013804.1:87-767(+)